MDKRDKRRALKLSPGDVLQVGGRFWHVRGGAAPTGNDAFLSEASAPGVRLTRAAGVPDAVPVQIGDVVEIERERFTVGGEPGYWLTFSPVLSWARGEWVTLVSS